MITVRTHATCSALGSRSASTPAEPASDSKTPAASGLVDSIMLKFGVDLAGALGEPPHQYLGHPLELPVPVSARGGPLHPQCPDELALVGGPVDGVRSQPMPIQIPAIQGRPATVRTLDPVGDDQVSVQQRVTFSGRPVVEPDRQQALSGHVLDTAVAAAGRQVLVQVGDRLGQPRVMGRQYGPAGRRVAQAVEDRDALGRPQDLVEGGHGVAAMGAAEQFPSRGVPAFEHGLEPGHGCFACQPSEPAPAPYHRPGLSPWPDRYCSSPLLSSPLL